MVQCDQRRGASETGTVPMARVHHKEPIALLVTHTGMGEKKLLGLVNDQIRSVRATADGRAGGYGGRAAQPRAGGVCRCRS